jgi:hypothetical protein
MSNPFNHRARMISGPAVDIVPVTPADNVDLTNVGIALYVESGGVIIFDTPAGSTRSVRVADFSILPVGVARVHASGTTASGIHVFN